MIQQENYEVNFFKPLSTHAKANKKLIIILASIWLVSVFGFQFLLMALNKPTPEKSYEVYKKVYPSVVEDADASTDMKRDFAKSLLFVIGKNNTVKPADKELLKSAFSWAIYSMQADSLKPMFNQGSNKETVDLAKQSLALGEEGFDKLLSTLIPYSIVPIENSEFGLELKKEIPRIMDLYLIHNQNVLTDIKFIGFPFHYWYTAQFLLILFVILCLIYAYAIEGINKKHNFIEET